MNIISYIISGALFVIFLIISAVWKLETSNTVWGVFGFFILCFPSLIGSLLNARTYRKQNSGRRYIFYVLSFVLGVWSLMCPLCMYLIAKGILQ